jgi:hypothetical protein
MFPFHNASLSEFYRGCCIFRNIDLSIGKPNIMAIQHNYAIFLRLKTKNRKLNLFCLKFKPP